VGGRYVFYFHWLKRDDDRVLLLAESRCLDTGPIGF
jgi:hypothetical protein